MKMFKGTTMKKIMFIVGFFIPNLVATQFPYIPSVPFHESMQTELYRYLLGKPLNKPILDFFEKLYTILEPKNLMPSPMPLITKKFHWIWLGGKHPERHELPEQYRAFQESWLTMHPDWEYYVWTEADLETFPFINKELFDAAKNYGQKSDIWRYEILYHFGGVYLDVDYECLKPIDAFNHYYHFYIGIQPLDTTMAQLGIGLIGSIAHHPILKHAIETLVPKKDIKQIIVATGPIHFTIAFLESAGRSGLRDIAMPASYFYPCGYAQKGMPRSVWDKPEAYAVHHWAGSWLSPQAMMQ